jgi:hypothetical protein
VVTIVSYSGTREIMVNEPLDAASCSSRITDSGRKDSRKAGGMCFRSA